MYQKYQPKSVPELEKEWAKDARWTDVKRPYSAKEVDRLRGTFQHDHTIARMGAERLWELLNSETLIRALGALTGNQAVQQVQAGLRAIYLSGWQVAGDANDAFRSRSRCARAGTRPTGMPPSSPVSRKSAAFAW